MTTQTEIVLTETLEKRSGMIVRVTGAVALLFAFIAIGVVPRLARQREALAAVREAPSHIQP
jgi:hypothetical protein